MTRFIIVPPGSRLRRTREDVRITVRVTIMMVRVGEARLGEALGIVSRSNPGVSLKLSLVSVPGLC